MDLAPSIYEHWAVNHLQKHPEDLIKNIKKENKSYEYVLDLGSGLGNVSQLLYKHLNVKQLIGLDIDEEMVKYATNKRPCSNINYYMQDVSLSWDNMRPEVKALEGNIDLAFSSYVFMFIRDRLTTAKNLARLLAPGGQFYAVVFALRDALNTRQDIDNKIAMKIPTPVEQMALWTDAFKGANLIVEQAQLYKFETTEHLDIIRKTFVEAINMSYDTFITEPDESKRKELRNQIKDDLVKNWRKYRGDVNGTMFCRVKFDIYWVKVVKPL